MRKTCVRVRAIENVKNFIINASLFMIGMAKSRFINFKPLG